MEATQTSRIQTEHALDLPQHDDPLIGTVLGGRYLVSKRIGEGGMGIVYEAKHTIIEKRMALKVLRADCSSRPDVVLRFKQEARSASMIGHENIVDISDFGETPQGQHYFVMEMLDGDDLANVLGDQTLLATPRALEIAVQCCRALGAAHAKGIVHRDMKPENIFLTRKQDGGEFVKIVDFGIAKMNDLTGQGESARKLTKTGMIFGTPEYMSPEQAAGKPLDHRVDIYAMGIILYEMLTGRVPFIGENFMGILTQHMFDEPRRLHEANPDCDVGTELEVIIFRALKKNPDERFQHMSELAFALQDQLDVLRDATAVGSRGPIRRFAAYQGEALSTQGKGMRRRTDDVVARPRRWWLGGMVALALVVTGAGVVYAMGWMGESLFDEAEGATTRPKGEAGAQDTGAQRSNADTDGRFAGAQNVEAGEGQAGGGDGSAGERGVLESGKGTEEESPAPVETEATVSIQTDPLGARVSVSSPGQDGEVVCETTPCHFEASLGVPLSIKAERDGRVAMQTLTLSENTTLMMVLQASESPSVARSRRRSSRRNERREGVREKNEGRATGDLKRPDFF